MNDSTRPQDADPKNQPDNVARYERWGKVAAGVAAVGYVLLVLFQGEDRFGPIGDAMGPLTGVLTALALFAAIEGVRLQREELKLQRQDLAESREVMREQARAAERSAETQERLAKAQEALAEAQKTANRLARRGQDLTLGIEIVKLENLIAETDWKGTQANVFNADKLAAEYRQGLARLRGARTKRPRRNEAPSET